ncbi:uncharacterized protein LOC131214671 [Anopheles bellator]|uniref:uncharacterized protein LOC131214671 n=1 Tax=Anopheles bellator TaxID=139047 RepID=UPI002647998F|nr:uncharacterized protein LOC131214671 [Anopheles bellator]
MEALPDGLDERSFEECLKYWAIKTNQTHRAINMLLAIMRKKVSSVSLPRSAKSLLKTSRKATSKIVEIGETKYWYNGIKNSLLHVLRSRPSLYLVKLNINIDGMKVFNASTINFWSVLINIHGHPAINPMPVAIFSAEKKPACLITFLTPLVEELKDLITNGLLTNEHIVDVSVRAFICDSPARAFIKGVMNFNAKHGCLKCEAEGFFEANTTVFPTVEGVRRTDAKFRQGEYIDHCKFATPLLEIPNFDIVEDVIVADRLHLIDLGIMKRLLSGWKDGTLGFNAKLTAQQVNEVSEKLKQIILPSEIHRKQRSLLSLAYWKGSELSSFLHYSSLVSLEEHVSKDVFQHFLLLFCSVTLFSSEYYKKYWSTAKSMLEEFVRQYEHVYGRRYITSNVHNLLHVSHEVDRFGPLSSLTAYPFENQLGNLKRLIRHGYNILEQAVNRLSEIEEAGYEHKLHQHYPMMKMCANRKQLFIDDNFILDCTRKDSFFLTKSNQIVKICDIKQIQGSHFEIFGNEYVSKSNRFTQPIVSSVINIYVVEKNSLSNVTSQFNIEAIKCKLAALDYKNASYVMIPIIHTLRE